MEAEEVGHCSHALAPPGADQLGRCPRDSLDQPEPRFTCNPPRVPRVAAEVTTQKTRMAAQTPDMVGMLGEGPRVSL